MASNSEVGHAKNVANFYDVISFVTGYGATYNPTRATLMLPQLTALHSLSQTGVADVITKNTAYNKVINVRADAFKDVGPLATRVLSALEATDASPATIADAKGFVRKLRGKRAKAINVDPDTPAPNTISTVQMSYDQQIQHFAGLIAVAQSEPSYAPNETDLQIVSLTAKLDSLTTKNNAVAAAYTSVSNSRIARNNHLYGTDTGIVDVAADVKKYTKSLYGASSPQYAQIKGIPFRKPRVY